MNAPTLSKATKPLTISLAALLLLTLISSAAAASGITANYSLQGSRTSSVSRQFILTTSKGTTTVTETRSDSLSASGTATVTWVLHEISANGSISMTRMASFKINYNGSISQGSENETTNITFSNTDADKLLEGFGPLMGHPQGILENVTINGQTYLAIHVSNSFNDHFTSTAHDQFSKTENGHTITVTVTRTVTRDISLSADFWFSKTSGILLKSAIQGNITVKVTANGTFGPDTFSMTATYTEAFSRTVTATSISGLSG